MIKNWKVIVCTHFKPVQLQTVIARLGLHLDKRKKGFVII